MSDDNETSPLEFDSTDFSLRRSEDDSFKPGQMVGPYKLLEVLGEGGFGIVYLAERREPHVQRVALKVIKPGMDSKAVIARFEQERQALAVMDHPNIAKVFDAGTTEQGRPYFVMEHVQGEPVTRYCDRHNLTVRQRLELFAYVCDAVQHAHMKGIIHRDIKPSNVIVSVKDEQPIAKVIDFGVAKAISHTLTDKTIFTEHGQIIGTPEYMSPEQAEMGAVDIDTRTDVYSLGVMLYELLTGALPFDPQELRSKGYNEIQRIIREVDPPKPSTRFSGLGEKTAAVAKHRQAKRAELLRELSRELDWIPLKAMRKDRTERYRTATDLADDIHRYLRGEALHAGPESAGYRLRKFLRRHRKPLIATVAVFLLLAVAFVVVLGTGSYAWYERQRALSSRDMLAAHLQAYVRDTADDHELLLSMVRPDQPDDRLIELLMAQESRIAALSNQLRAIGGGRVRQVALDELDKRMQTMSALLTLMRYRVDGEISNIADDVLVTLLAMFTNETEIGQDFLRFIFLSTAFEAPLYLSRDEDLPLHPRPQWMETLEIASRIIHELEGSVPERTYRAQVRALWRAERLTYGGMLDEAFLDSLEAYHELVAFIETHTDESLDADLAALRSATQIVRLALGKDTTTADWSAEEASDGLRCLLTDESLAHLYRQIGKALLIDRGYLSRSWRRENSPFEEIIEAASALLEASIRQYRDHHEPTEAGLIDAIIMRGVAFVWSDEYTRARRFFEDALDRMHDSRPVEPVMKAVIYRYLGWTSLVGDFGLGYHFREAEQNLLRSEELYREIGETDSSGYRATIQLLAAVYSMWHNRQPEQGFDAKASYWREKVSRNRP